MSTKRIKQIVFAFALLCLCALASADTYSYDKLGRLTSINYANGDSIAYSYDEAGNLVKVVAVNVSHPPPVCTLAANPASVPAGGSSTLAATCDGAPNSYVWTGSTCADTIAATCTVSPSVTTTYTVAGIHAGGSGAPASATITVTAAPVFPLTVSTTGAGTVTSNPAGINCGATCSANFDSGSSVTLTAVATAGNTFSGWGGDCSGLTACVVTMSAARNVSANFIVDTTGGNPTVQLALVQGWNLLGNGLNQSITVASVFGDPSMVATVWKWDAATPGWRFYTPQMNAPTLQTYAASKGYSVLTTINSGDGFWVNSRAAFTVQWPAGAMVESGEFQNSLVPPNRLPTGWSLIAIGDNKTPAGFNGALSSTPPAFGVISVNLTSLWAWDSLATNWRFYAPSLDAAGTLDAYIVSKGYMGFGAGTLSPGTGFWVNKP